jgi:hypothetical protein
MSAKQVSPKYHHEHYKRWVGMIQRCYNPNNRSFEERRKKNVLIDLVWHPDNPAGLDNYANWINAELLKHPELNKEEFRVARIKQDKNYGPDNCHLITHVDITRDRITTVLCVDKVVEMRRFKKENPGATLLEMEIKFGFSQANISRALRGVSWTNADKIEAPLPKFSQQDKKERTIALVGNDRNQTKEST